MITHYPADIIGFVDPCLPKSDSHRALCYPPFEQLKNVHIYSFQRCNPSSARSVRPEKCFLGEQEFRIVY